MFPRSQGRGSKYQQKAIDANILHISYEGAEDEFSYFEELIAVLPKQFAHLIKIIPVDKQDTSKSSPSAVVNDLLNHLETNKVNLRSKGDKAYVVIDVDHHFTGKHMTATDSALRTCKDKGIKIICNCPAVDLWFICHYESPVDWSDDFKKKALVNKQRFLKKHLGAIRNAEPMSELIKRTETARINSKNLRDLSTHPHAIPPTELLPNMDLIWNDIDEMGIDTTKFLLE